ncbi:MULTISPECIES: TIGR04255 family protein [unclassified Bradyrhizobium]|uniref:TIGR04255 family protein n=1 Tax=unclassified Bradyrhizobium TaxID=2631580 RepID=UPI0029164FFD|nr:MULTISPECIES: TIGR04255 family protein [unclassified Bradyrhizobium]
MQKLPTFGKPPVDEVYLSIQFASLAKFKSAHIGMFWEEIRHSFPEVTEQAPINPVFETFGGIRFGSQPPALQFLASPLMPRYWFERPGEPALLQLQQDRILRNWRQSPERSREYPRYEAIRSAFEKDVAGFQDWLNDEELGAVVPNQCEVSYINGIRMPDGSNPHTQLHRISNVWSETLALPGDQKLEQANVQLTSVFEIDGRPAGRVYTNFQPGFSMITEEPVVKLEIIARGKPLEGTIPSAFEFLDRARAEIVTTFASITTSEMHKFWERTDG